MNDGIIIDIGFDFSSVEASIKQVNNQLQSFAKNNATKGLASGFDSAVASSQKFITSQKQVLASMQLAGQGGSESYKKLENELISVINQSEKLDKATQDVEKSLSKSTSGGFLGGIKDGIGEGLSGLASFVNPATLVAGAVAGIGVAITKTIEVGKEFQTNLAAVSAVTGVTGKGLNELSDGARGLALRFGGDASDQLKAFQGILSRFGGDLAKTPEALNTVTESVNLLGKAGGLDAASAMDALTNSMLQFGVDVANPNEAAKQSSRFMNVLAASAKVGAAEIPQVAEAILQAGVAAKGANLSFEETNAAIQRLAVGGKVGSEAGVGLRNVLNLLQKQSGEGDKVLAKLGLTTQKLGTDLQKGGLAVALESLKNGLNKLSDPVQKNQALMQLFGAESSSAAGILLEGTDQIREFTKGVTGTQEGLTQANTNMNTFAESTSRLKAFINDLMIGAFLKLEPVISKAINGLTSVFQDFGKEVVASLGKIDFSGFIEALKPIAVIVGGMLVASFMILKEAFILIIDLVKIAIDNFKSMMQPLTDLFKTFGDGAGLMDGFSDVLKFIATYIKGVFVVALTIMTATTRAVIFVVANLIKYSIELYNWFTNLVKQSPFLTKVFQTISDVVLGLYNAIKNVGTAIGEFLGIIDKATKKPKKVEVQADTKQAQTEVKKLEKPIETAVKPKMDSEASNKLKEDYVKIMKDIQSTIFKTTQDIQKLIADDRVKDLEEQKQLILDNVAITEEERLKKTLEIDTKIANQKLTNNLQSLEQQKQAELQALNSKIDDDLKANKYNATQRNAIKEQQRKEQALIEEKYDLLTIDAYENTANEIQKVDKANNKELEKISKEQLKKDAEAQKQYNELYLASIKDVNEREKQTALFSLQDKLDADLEKFKDNEAIKTALIEKFQVDRSNIEAKFKPVGIFDNIGKDFSENIKSIDWSKFFNTKDLQDKRKSVDSEFKKQQSDLKSQYNKGTLSYEEYQNSLTDLDNKRTDDLKDIASQQKSVFDGVNEAITKSLEELIKTQETQIQNNINGNKDVEESYSSLATIVGSTTAMMVANGESAQKALIMGALAGVKSLVAINAPMILGQSISWVGPIAGPILAGVLTGSMYALLGIAESAVANAGFKDGVINLQGAGTETSDSIPARLSKGESVINAKATRQNMEILKFINDGGNAKDFYQNTTTLSVNPNGELVSEVRAMRMELKHAKLQHTDVKVKIVDVNNKEVKTKRVGLHR